MEQLTLIQERKLHVGEGRNFKVQARPKWNDISVDVESGERYRFSATGLWYDATIKSGPEGYVCDRWIFRMTEHWLRLPNARWFALVGAVGHQSTGVFLVGDNAVVTMSSAGPLSFFANDLPFMYGNNSGEISLQIVREA